MSLLSAAAILAHALRIILDTTPPHPTLLSILLDVCSAHRLEYLSAIILEALFRSAMHATPSSASAPLCHPTNSLFLVDLYERWCEAHFTAQAFTRILLDALHASGVRAVWTSKALGKLSRQLCKADLYPFFQLAGGLAHVITSPTRFPGDVGTEQHTLANWCHQALDRLSTLSLQSPQNADGNHENIGEFLEYLDGIISPSLGNPCDPNLVDAIISLATHWLTLQSAPGTSRPTNFATTLLMLRQTAPRTSTYNRLISNVFSPNIGVSNPKTKDVQQTLQRYASSLRSYDLFHLEASLWASALGHVESSDVESQLASHEGHAAVRNFRYLLIDTVEEVEERCLERITSGAAVTPLKRKRFVAPQGSYPSHAHTDWRWEKILGCWIQKQSPLKAKTQRKANYIGTAYSPGPLSTIQRLRRKRTNLASSPCKRASFPATTLPAAQNRAGVYEIRVGKGFRSRPSRRSSNFASLLSDAQAHRTVLHPKSSTRRHTKAGLESFHLPISPAIVSPIPRPHSLQGPFKSGIDPQCPPMSDDLMDLFDHPPSSPSIRKPIVRFRSRTLQVMGKNSKPLSLANTLNDLALIRSLNITLPVQPHVANQDSESLDASLAKSQEFIYNTRQAMKIVDRGEVEREGERVELARNQLDELLTGLRATTPDDRT
ncbi:hypothetical protein BD779DRAFT_1670670 [Infundibulicybe gibba]|nr:hypothetical protein BD779DRAFT_1670670 [Infundibulicybe gibba]